MKIIYIILGVISALVGAGCSIFVLIEAFRDEIWKGIVSLICGLYWLYYAIFEFEHDNKWLIVLMALGGSSIAYGFWALAAGAA